MEYQKIINLVDNTPNRLSKLRIKDQVEIYDEAHGRYNTIRQIKLKTTMLNLTLCNYSDAYILVKVTLKEYIT